MKAMKRHMRRKPTKMDTRETETDREKERERTTKSETCRFFNEKYNENKHNKKITHKNVLPLLMSQKHQCLNVFEKYTPNNVNKMFADYFILNGQMLLISV